MRDWLERLAWGQPAVLGCGRDADQDVRRKVMTKNDQGGLPSLEKKMLSGDGGLAQQFVVVKVLLAAKEPLRRDSNCAHQAGNHPAERSTSLEGRMTMQKRPSILIDGKPAKASLINGKIAYPNGKITVAFGPRCKFGFCTDPLTGRLGQLCYSGYIEQSESTPYRYSLTAAGLREAKKGDVSIVEMCQAANSKLKLTEYRYNRNSNRAKSGNRTTAGWDAAAIKKSNDLQHALNSSKSTKVKDRLERDKAITPRTKRFKASPYPWDDWFDDLNEDGTNNKILVKGVEFNCQPHSMAVQLRRAAFEFKFKVSVIIEGDRIVIRKRVPLG